MPSAVAFYIPNLYRLEGVSDCDCPASSDTASYERPVIYPVSDLSVSAEDGYLPESCRHIC